MRSITRHLATAAAVGLLGAFVAAAPLQQAGQAETQAATAKVGEEAPKFELKNAEDKTFKLEDLKGKVVVLEWTNPQCPWIQKAYEEEYISDTIEKLEELYGDDWAYIAINSSSDESEADVMKRNTRFMKEHDIDHENVMLLFDYDGKIGQTYDAKRTPEMYIIDTEGVLRYQGAYGDRPSGSESDANYVITALEQLKAGDTISPSETRAWGCTIKYPRRDARR